MSIPVVPTAAFRTLVGELLAPRLDSLLQRQDFSEIILFSDVSGEQLALVAVGPDKRFTYLSEATGAEIDGLRPLCALRACVQSGESAASEARARELAELQRSLEARERYVAECEQRVAEVGQNLSEREAMLEQREHMLLEKERDFFRRGGMAATKKPT
ncbi:MAG: hypothetical protein EAZ36_04245 [Verrucomicrobia bacterium]|nr:MAG: hypothetical protein EAZ36_04245 [Verrucomicrobiota bacterium]